MLGKLQSVVIDMARYGMIGSRRRDEEDPVLMHQKFLRVASTHPAYTPLFHRGMMLDRRKADDSSEVAVSPGSGGARPIGLGESGSVVLSFLILVSASFR